MLAPSLDRGICPRNAHFSQQHQCPDSRPPFGPVHIFPITPVTRWMLFPQVLRDRTPGCNPVQGRFNLCIALGPSENILERPVSNARILILQEPGYSLVPLCDLDSTSQYCETPIGESVIVLPIKANSAESYWSEPYDPEIAIEIGEG